MKCPHCGKEMKDKSHFIEITFLTGDEPDYYPTEWYEEYHCKDCKIKYDNGNWIIPKAYTPATDKQIKCVNFINRQLNTYHIPVLKHQTWKFIKENLSKAQEAYNNSFSEWCEDNSDWLPEEF